MRLIDADALESKGIKLETHGGATFIALGNVRIATTIDPEELRPKGEWTKNSNGRTCDQCKFVYYSNHKKGFNYCPNCGADMRGKEHG